MASVSFPPFGLPLRNIAAVPFSIYFDTRFTVLLTKNPSRGRIFA